ncbi:CPBP family intramembrane glutamic endopeptidase [Fodinibius saliphilus]|uniref:CPBP family intramembrane glutamic endopeptidase n=1 Tax=Fodinibius saliphilus TaxID=1920650 RepID=UPI001109B74A|nr:CPBP family intramembrane glutamic endopeptidase [Fodinibius saliphilus]
MTNTTKSIRNYFSTTHSLLYSYLISLPLLLAYEVLIFIAQPNSEQVVRISVDVWVKTLFSYIGQDVLSITLIFVALLGIYVLYSEREQLSSLKLRYFGGMIFESSVYAFILGLMLTVTVSNLLQMLQTSPIESLSMLQQFALSLGAGLYEELFFRVILVSALLYIFKRFFSNKYISFGSAIIFAALIFSLVHYIGVMGDPFTMGSFLFRFLFGLALNAIYIWRGFGVAAWTHAIYDIMVIIY